MKKIRLLNVIKIITALFILIILYVIYHVPKSDNIVVLVNNCTRILNVLLVIDVLLFGVYLGGKARIFQENITPARKRINAIYFLYNCIVGGYVVTYVTLYITGSESIETNNTMFLLLCFIGGMTWTLMVGWILSRPLLQRKIRFT